MAELTELEQAIVFMFAHFGGPGFRGIHEQSKLAYVDALKGHDLEAVRASIKWHEDHSEKLPKPSQIIDRMPSTRTVQKFVAWGVDGCWSGDLDSLSNAQREEIADLVADYACPNKKGPRFLSERQKEFIAALGFGPGEKLRFAEGRRAERAEALMAANTRREEERAKDSQPAEVTQ